MDGLNLELSESFKEDQLQKALDHLNDPLIKKGQLLDSLDLNTGFDAFQKKQCVLPSIVQKVPTPTHQAQNIPINQSKFTSHSKPVDYQIKDTKNEVKESDLRDSLDEDDWGKFNDRLNNEEPQDHINENIPKQPEHIPDTNEHITDDEDFERADDGIDWLRQSMRESMSNWKKEVEKLQNHQHNSDINTDQIDNFVVGHNLNRTKQSSKIGSKKQIDFKDALDEDDMPTLKKSKEDKEPLVKKSKASVQTKSKERPKVAKNPLQKKDEFKPQQIPIEEYYKMLNQR